MHTYTPENSIFDGPVTNLLSLLCILIEVPSRGHAKILSLALLLVVFRSDDPASLAVKGLILWINIALE